MAKRAGSISSLRRKKSPPKTKKRLEAKKQMLAMRAPSKRYAKGK